MFQDLRFGMRMMLKQPGFTLITVLTLALGIGANTAIFSVVNAVLLRPLPYPNPEQLVGIYDSLPSIGAPRVGLSEAEFINLRSQNRSFSEVAAWYPDMAMLRGVGEPERVNAPRVSANYFRLLGANVELGRDFRLDEESAGKNNVAILSHGFWQRKFAGDPAVIGRALTLDDTSFTIIGVLPASLKTPLEMRADTRIDLWRVYDLGPAGLRRGSQFLNVIGRLRPGVTFTEAQAESQVNTRREATEYPKFYPPDIFNFLEPLNRSIIGEVRPALLILMAAVAVVLLIACANVANLLLVRSEKRQTEIAVRAALGASSGRIIRQLLIETLLLTMLGGVGGLLLARWGLSVLVAISPENLPRLTDTSIDMKVISFTLLVSLLTAVVFGLVPALHAAKFDLHTTLKGAGRGTGQIRSGWLRQLLVVLETALAVVVLIAAGLLVRSFWELQRVDAGFKLDHLLTMHLTPPSSAYRDSQQIVSLYQRIIGRINTLPGVQSAAVADPLPISGYNRNTVIEIENRQFDMNRLTHMSVDFRTVSPEYFQTISMRLVKGRLFTDADREGALPVTIVNETLARNHWPGEDPIGKRFRYLDGPPDRATTRFLTIIGVIADAKNRALADAARQEAFIPLAQHAVTYGRVGMQRAFNLLVRTTGNPADLANSVQRGVREVEPDFATTQIRTMDQLLEAAFMQPRFNLILLGLFALLAMVLGAVGLYGVIVYTVTQRTHEIGIRMALGAQSRDVLKLVIGQGVKLTLVGILLGLGGAWMLTRLMKTLLFNVSATDPLTFVAIAILLAGVALLACWLPARRAARIDPLIALRNE